MSVQKLQRVGNYLIVIIPEDEVERQSLREGDEVRVAVQKAQPWSELSPELRAAAERSWAEGEAAYRYLADQ